MRAWQGGVRPGRRRRRRRVVRPEWLFVFDTETSVDAAQRLRVGCVRVIRRGELVQEALFCEQLTGQELALLRRYCAERELELLTIGEFRDWFFRFAYRLRATVVGFNLPFDLSRIALDWSPARGSFKGGWSLTLWQRKDGGGENRFRPRLRVKTLNRRAALIEFAAVPRAKRDGPSWRGRFLDLKTLAAALTDKAMTLDQAAVTFGTEHRKLGDIRHGEPLTDRYLDYLRRDALVTNELHDRLLADYQRHPIALDAGEAYSSASIGKAYLEAFGITPPLERSTLTDEQLGYWISAFFGGRAECRIRRETVPVSYLDVRSMYPTVFTLMGLTRFLTAVEIGSEEATEEVRELVERVELEDLFDPELWSELVAVVEVEPNMDVLPVRMNYAGSARSIGVNYFTSRERWWYALPDLIASKLLTRQDAEDPSRAAARPARHARGPEAGQAARHGRDRPAPGRALQGRDRRARADPRQQLAPRGRARGKPEVPQDVRQRHRLRHHRRAQPQRRRKARQARTPLTPLVRGQSARRAVRPLLLPAACHHDHRRRAADPRHARALRQRRGRHLCLHGHRQHRDDNRLRRARAEPRRQKAQRQARRAPARRRRGDRRALRRAQPLQLRRLDPQGRGRELRRGLRRAQAALRARRLRQALRTLQHRRRRQACDPKALRTRTRRLPTTTGSRRWLGLRSSGSRSSARQTGCSRPRPNGKICPRPGGSRSPAPNCSSRSSSTTAATPSRQSAHTASSPSAYPKPFTSASDLRLFAPYVADPRTALEISWNELRSGEHVRITVEDPLGELIPGLIPVKSYGDVAREYAAHPESKFRAPDGGPCLRTTAGALRRRMVSTERAEYIGKEGNLLDRRAEGPGAAPDAQQLYEDPEDFRRYVLPELATLPRAEVAEAVGISTRALNDILAGRSTPRLRTRQALVRVLANTSHQPPRR